jgi:hypothetical protein
MVVSQFANTGQKICNSSDELSIAFNQAKDYQRILQEIPETIGTRFKLVEDTKARYSIHENAMHNFDETGLQMEIIGLTKVVTGAERCTQPELVQPSNCKWIPIIQNVYAARSCTLLFIVYKGYIHISAWYEEADIPRNWKLR